MRSRHRRQHVLNRMLSGDCKSPRRTCTVTPALVGFDAMRSAGAVLCRSALVKRRNKHSSLSTFRPFVLSLCTKSADRSAAKRLLEVGNLLGEDVRLILGRVADVAAAAEFIRLRICSSVDASVRT